MDTVKTQLKDIQEATQSIQQKLFLVSGGNNLSKEQTEFANDAREGFDFWRRRAFKPLFDSFLSDAEKS